MINALAECGAEIVALVAMDIQTRPHTAQDRIEGGASLGGLDIWATAEQLAAAYLDGGDPNAPLGWTSLLVSPAEYSEGPAGDRVEWVNAGELRIYEITSLEPYDETGPLIASGRKYGATDRGAA